MGVVWVLRAGCVVGVSCLDAIEAFLSLASVLVVGDVHFMSVLLDVLLVGCKGLATWEMSFSI